MQILSDTLFLACVFLIAACMAGIAQGIREDSEQRRLKRRAFYRRKAYADVYRRRCQNENRAELWRRYVK